MNIQNISLLRDIVPFITQPLACHESLNYSLVKSYTCPVLIIRVRLSTLCADPGIFAKGGGGGQGQTARKQL